MFVLSPLTHLRHTPRGRSINRPFCRLFEQSPTMFCQAHGAVVLAVNGVFGKYRTTVQQFTRGAAQSSASVIHTRQLLKSRNEVVYFMRYNFNHRHFQAFSVSLTYKLFFPMHPSITPSSPNI